MTTAGTSTTRTAAPADLRLGLGVGRGRRLLTPMSDPARPTPRPLTAGRAAVLFAVYSVVFAVGGGLAAGIPAVLFEAVTGTPFNEIVYAIMFGVTGFIAYRLARRVAEG